MARRLRQSGTAKQEKSRTQRRKEKPPKNKILLLQSKHKTVNTVLQNWSEDSAPKMSRNQRGTIIRRISPKSPSVAE
jgi:hypothetical protein